MKIKLILLFLAISFTAMAQLEGTRYVVTFKDKNNSPFSYDRPLEFLSQKAINRRAKFNIPFDKHDLPVNPSYVTQVKQAGGEIVGTLKWFNGVILKNPSETVLANIAALSFVKEVLPGLPKTTKGIENTLGNYNIEGIPPYSFSQNNEYYPRYKSQTGVFDYGNALNQIAMIKMDELHNLGYTGKGITIGVLDGGFANTNIINGFDSLFLQNRILGTFDAAEKGNDVFASTMNGHGTSVLSVMGANRPGLIVGSAPHASYWLIRTEVTGQESRIEEYQWSIGAAFADSVGVDVINSSLGYTEFDNSLYNYTYEMMDGNTAIVTRAADIAVSKGILVVNSAGNEGSSQWKYIGAPADGDSVLTVGATNYKGHWASFSSWGPTFDGRIKPDVSAQGSGTWLLMSTGTAQGGNGTSFSSPLIAGSMACLMQALPNYSPMKLIKLIRSTSSYSSNPNDTLGYGIPNFKLALTTSGINNPDYTNKSLTLYRSSETQLTLLSAVSLGKSVIEIYTASGSLAIKEDLNIIQGSQTITLPKSLSSGVYIIRVSSNDFRESHKIVL
ncbi:MAG: S8 family serine peptidase [Sphingobacteriia bacterium]|nr:S8 family serine peptidase [Sphingobacteriia bacterium]